MRFGECALVENQTGVVRYGKRSNEKRNSISKAQSSMLTFAVNRSIGKLYRCVCVTSGVCVHV